MAVVRLDMVILLVVSPLLSLLHVHASFEVHSIDKHNFGRQVVDSTETWIVEFYSPRCMSHTEFFVLPMSSAHVHMRELAPIL
jgi:hypothetical protein